MQRAYLTASAALRCRQRAALMELKLDAPTKFAAVPMPAAGGERHD
jgi:hypothetical protein